MLSKRDTIKKPPSTILGESKQWSMGIFTLWCKSNHCTCLIITRTGLWSKYTLEKLDIRVFDPTRPYVTICARQKTGVLLPLDKSGWYKAREYIHLGSLWMFLFTVSFPSSPEWATHAVSIPSLLLFICETVLTLNKILMKQLLCSTLQYYQIV